MASAPTTLTPARALTASGHERPVFLDESGRRARLVRLGGRLLGGATAAWLGALVLGAWAPPTLPSLAVQLASIRAASATAIRAEAATSTREATASATVTANAGGRGRDSLVSQLSLARLTSRPAVGRSVARATADIETRAA